MLKNNIIKIVIFIFFIFFIKKIFFMSKKEHFSIKKFKLKILVPFYNPGSEVLERCLKSIIRQKNDYGYEYDVCMIDDFSSKQCSLKEQNILYAIMDKYTNKYKNFYSIKKKENLGTLHSNILGMKKLNCNDDDVVIILDGDDELYGDDALNTIFKTYKENDVYVTFGNYYRRYKNNITKTLNVDCNRDYATIIRNHSYRSMDTWFGFSHLKTFKYKLFASVPNRYFKDKNNNYFKSSTDLATMVAVLERSGGKFKCINKPIYVYTSDHPNSHHNNQNGLKKQKKNELYIRSDVFKPLDPIV